MEKSRKMLCFAIMFFWASEYCHAPYFTPYLTSLGFSSAVIGVMLSTYGLTQAIARIPLGMITDKTSGYLFVVRMGTFFTTISSFGLIFAKTRFLVTVCRILAGAAASTWIAFTILFSSYYASGEGTTAMVGANVFNNGGKLLGFVLGTMAASLWSYRMSLVMSFLTGLAAMFFAFNLKEIPIKKEPVKFAQLLSTFKDVTVLLPALFAVLMQFILHGTAFSFTSNAAEARGANEIEIGVITTLFTLTQIASAGFMKKFVIAKLGSVKTVAFGFGLLGLECAIIALSKSVFAIMVGQVIGGAGNLITSSVLMSLTIKYVPTENKSTAMGMFQAIYGIGMTLGPIVVGAAIGDGRYTFAYLICAGICAAALALSLVLLPISEKIGGKRNA